MSENLAYFAGLFDGEGSASVILHKRKAYYALVQITMLDNPVIVEMAQALGGNVNYHHAKSGKKTVRAIWNGQSCGPMLRALRPYLRVKADRADAVLSFLELKTSASSKNLPELFEPFRQRLITLNRGKCHL